MNKSAQKLYLSLCNNLYCLSQIPQSQTGVISRLQSYGEYSYYLARNWAPRVSTIQTTSDAYTPQRTLYSAYIVYFILATMVVDETLAGRREQKKADDHYMKLRD